MLQSTGLQSTGLQSTGTSRAAAALRVYEQECALHDAHSSGVTAWISQAEQALHAAILTYEAANTAA